MCTELWHAHRQSCPGCLNPVPTNCINITFEAFAAATMKNAVPLRTSQETHYLSTTEPRRLMICEAWGFRGDDYEECRLLGCADV
jgi:hypothetical protein